MFQEEVTRCPGEKCHSGEARSCGNSYFGPGNPTAWTAFYNLMCGGRLTRKNNKIHFLVNDNGGSTPGEECRTSRH